MGRGWAQDAGPVPRIHPHGSWHYARIVPVSTVTDRRVIGMVLKTKRRTDGKSGKSCLGAKAEVDGGEDASSAERRGRTPGRIVVQRLQDNEDGSKGAAEKAGTSPPPPPPPFSPWQERQIVGWMWGHGRGAGGEGEGHGR